MNYVVTRNEVTCTKINHTQLYVEQVAKCRIEWGAKHRFVHGSETLGSEMTCTELWASTPAPYTCHVNEEIPATRDLDGILFLIWLREPFGINHRL